MTPPDVPFAAVVLAGGRSTRMGADKADLPHPDGQPLLLRQLQVLRELKPAELLVSARAGQRLPALPPGARRIDDDGSAGPLGGIVAIFQATSAARLLVLAVDLPNIEPRHLQPLLAVPKGAVYQHENRREPLAAVYPREILPLAQAALEQSDFSLQRLLDSPAARRYFRVLPTVESAPFTNWNRPEDRTF